MSKPQRLDAILARYGYSSRSEARDWIRGGRVVVNGTPAESPSQKALTENVLIDKEPVEHPNGILALLNKPAGLVCSHDPLEGPSVYKLFPRRWMKRNPPITTIGRLDKDTTGVLLITDIGELVQRWTSPQHKVAKVYEVTVDADLNPALVTIFASGELRLEGEDKPCRPAILNIHDARHASLEIVEGKYHQIKRMFAGQGLQVLNLHRSRFGEFEVGDLEPGQWRALILENHKFR